MGFWYSGMILEENWKRLGEAGKSQLSNGLDIVLKSSSCSVNNWVVLGNGRDDNFPYEMMKNMNMVEHSSP